MWSSIIGRVILYSMIFWNMTIWSLQQAVAKLFKKQHPLQWPADQDFNIMLLKTLFTSGTYVHWRNFMALWQVLNGKREQEGLKLQQLPPDTFGAPGCRSSWWISLDPSQHKDAPPVKASCVLMFLHGGAFMAGEPLMYCPAFKHWMRQLAAQGIRMRVLSVGYPLAPENPFPVAVVAAAAAYRWLLKQLEAEGSQEAVILGGDSAGGNLVLASLAYLQDPTLLQTTHSSNSSSTPAAPQPPVPPPAGAVLISPATDFTSSSIFGPKLKCYFSALRSEQQHAKQQGTAEHAVDVSHLPATPQPGPRGSEWDYIDAGEGASVAQLYVGAQSEADMAQPLVSPAVLPNFKSLVQHGMLVMWGGVEAMAPDIARLGAKMQAQGVSVETCVEANEPHVYCVLPFKGVIRKGAKVLVPFIESCVSKF